jgi:hypothetical protein
VPLFFLTRVVPVEMLESYHAKSSMDQFTSLLFHHCLNRFTPPLLLHLSRRWSHVDGM